MKDSWVGFGYRMALHKENFTSVMAYYQEVFCFPVEIHFPVLFATWRSVFAGVYSPRAYHPKTQRELCGVPRDMSFLVPQGKQSSGGDPRSVGSTAWVIIFCPKESNTASELCFTVPLCHISLSVWQQDSWTWGWEAPWTGCSLIHSRFPSELRDHRPERRWASHQHFLFSLSQNHRIIWFGRDHSGSSGPIVLILRRL